MAQSPTQSSATRRGFLPRSSSSSSPPPFPPANEYDSVNSDGADDNEGEADDTLDSVDDEPRLAVDEVDEEKAGGGGLITLCGRFRGVSNSPLSLRASISLVFSPPAAAEEERDSRLEMVLRPFSCASDSGCGICTLPPSAATGVVW